MLGLDAVSEAPVSDLGAISANHATLAYTEPPDAVAILSITTNAATLAYTEPADAVAITTVVPDFAILAYTEPPDGFTIAQPQVSPLRERTYHHRMLGYSFDPEITITKDRPGPLRILECDFWMN